MKQTCVGRLSAYARVIMVLTISALLISCAAPGRPIPEARLSSIKTIGVISVAAFRLNMFDTTPFSIPPYKGSIDVSDMALDELAVQKIAGLLSPAFVIKPVTYKPAEFLSEYQPNTDTFFRFQGCPNVIPDMGEITKRLPSDAAVDAYVVLYPRCVPAVAFDGLIFEKHNTVFEILGNYTSAVIDARTHEILGAGGVFMIAKADKSEWPEGMRFNDEQKPRFRKDFEAALDYGIGPFLKGVGLLR